MRCNNCNQFVSHEAEIGDSSYDFDPETADFSGTVTINLNCANCGGTLADAESEVNFILIDALEHVQEMNEAADEDENPQSHDLEWVEKSLESDDFFKATDRHGKPIKSAHYQKHMYQARITGGIVCSCGEEWDIDFTSEAYAGNEFNPS